MTSVANAPDGYTLTVSRRCVNSDVYVWATRSTIGVRMTHRDGDSGCRDSPNGYYNQMGASGCMILSFFIQ